MHKVQVAIIGAGPAGLLLAHLLHREGISVAVLEAKSRDYLETSPHRIRAGVLEWGTREILVQAGLGD
ncbi:FAD-dependent monooxygenase, partial [Acinetobacter baumannii]